MINVFFEYLLIVIFTLAVFFGLGILLKMLLVICNNDNIKTTEKTKDNSEDNEGDALMTLDEEDALFPC